jgi:tripartite-type tricarboxylate transporter receptor subunit TctC
MRFHHRRFLHLAGGAVTLQAVTRVASALDHPTRPVRLLVGFAAAGPTDIAARFRGVVGRSSALTTRAIHRVSRLICGGGHTV